MARSFKLRRFNNNNCSIENILRHKINSKFKWYNKKSTRAKCKDALRNGREIPLFKNSNIYLWVDNF